MAEKHQDVEFGAEVDKNGRFVPTITFRLLEKVVTFTADVALDEKDCEVFQHFIYDTLTGPHKDLQVHPGGVKRGIQS
jgi:hypothetical protein